MSAAASGPAVTASGGAPANPLPSSLQMANLQVGRAAGGVPVVRVYSEPIQYPIPIPHAAIPVVGMAACAVPVAELVRLPGARKRGAGSSEAACAGLEARTRALRQGRGRCQLLDVGRAA